MHNIKSLSRFIVIFGLLISAFVSFPQAVSAAAPAVAPAASGKRIVVNLAQQHVYAYQGNSLVFSTRANINGARRGTFHVETKMPMAASYVLGWRLPYWLGIYYGPGGIENGFHGYSLRNTGGIATNSLGCIVMPTAAAARLYAWASMGTPVMIY